jgi:protein-S-isoprenylcysteine O-methyltransferase Ste14
MNSTLTLCHYWITGLWVVMVGYWAIAALFAKREGKRQRRRSIGAFHLALAIIFATILAVRSPQIRAIEFAIYWNESMAIAGAILTTLGAAMAFSARAAIGRNWGAPGVRKTSTELVTAGPYRFIRHPIYSGILLMIIGTAVGLTPVWWLVAAVSAVWFIHSARAEEKHMTERFPDAYPAYRGRTKMLVPFLL